MTKRERHKIAIKKREWDEALRPFNTFWKKMTKEVKYNVNNWLEFYFGDKDNKETVEKWLRRIVIILIDLAILKLLGLI